jgi:hypothetical protein
MWSGRNDLWQQIDSILLSLVYAVAAVVVKKGKVVPVLTNYALCHEAKWGSGCKDYVFLTSALVGCEW